MPGGQVHENLVSWSIDATEWVGPYNDRAFGFHQAARYYYYPGWHEPGAMLEFTINAQVFAALPEHYQAILRTAARAVNQDMLDEYTASNNKALVDLVEQQKVQLRRFPDDVLSELKRVSETVVAEAVANDTLGQRIYRSYLDYREQVTAYHRISELAYLSARE